MGGAVDSLLGTSQQYPLSVAQAAFFLAYTWTLCLWLLSEYLSRFRRPSSQYESLKEDDMEHQHSQRLKHHSSDASCLNAVSISQDAPRSREANGADALAELTLKGNSAGGSGDGGQAGGVAHVRVTTPAGKGSALPVSSNGSSSGSMQQQGSSSLLADMAGSNLVRCVMLDLNVIQAERATLKAMAEFGGLMAWYYLCDRTSVVPAADKSYSRDLFVFLFLVLTLVAGGSSLQTVKQPVVLVRQQTEEWKGWMQVLFLLYHYFEAKEVYNAIRLFIAAYVWMTGFGNFLYYYKTNDYSIGRFSQMMWRLNFLVFFACVVLRNSYMLYYICPMHTIFTVMVYASLGICYHLNQHKAWIWGKLLLCIGAVLLLWDCTPVFYAVWAPFKWLMGYVDPRKPNDDELYEWHFRSSLDRYIWIYGMLCGYLHPWFSSVLAALDNMSALRRTVIRTLALAACAVLGYVYYVHIYCLPKLEYNKVHPYTSWIPITLWILVRNLTPTLRLHHLRLYGWLGCITLETYICQFHVWMKTGVPDGQPKQLVSVLPGYPLLNFAVVTAGYVYVSYRLFELTNIFKNIAVPHSNNYLLLRNTLLMGCAGLLLYLTTYGAMHMLVYRVL